MRPRYINVTDRETEGRLTITMPRFALRASRGNKCGNVTDMNNYRDIALCDSETKILEKSHSY